MPDTTLLHLLTGHTVRTTSTVQAALDALKPAALPDYGLAKLEDAHGHVVYLRPEHAVRWLAKAAARWFTSARA